MALSEKIQGGTEEVVSDFMTAGGKVDAVDSSDSFSGKTADSVKRYLKDFHQEMFVGFENLFVHMSETFTEQIEDFKEEVDESDSAIIQLGYLEEIKRDMDVQHQVIDNCEGNINRTLEKVADIINLEGPSFMNVRDKYEDTTERIEELEENFTTFFDRGKKDHNKSKELVSALDLLMKKAQYNTGDTRLKDFEGGAWSSEQATVKKAVSGVNMGADILEKYAEGNVKDSSKPKKENNTITSQKTSEVKAKNTKVDIKRTAQKVYGTTLKHIKVTGPLAPLGIAVDGVENYHDAETLGLTGWDKTKYVAKETMYDFALTSLSFAAATALVASFGVGLTSLPGLLMIAGLGISFDYILNGSFKIDNQTPTEKFKNWSDGKIEKVKDWF